MREYTRGKIGIISCNSGRHFAEKVIYYLQKIMLSQGEPDLKISKQSGETWFSNGEMKTELKESLRNEDVYIIQDCANHAENRSVNDNYMALKTAIETAKRADAHYITAVIPYFPYSRQDRKKSREGITAEMVARELESAGANRVLTLDIHNESTEGFFRKASFENLRASKCIIEFITREIDTSNLVVVAPDVGAVGRNEFYANLLKTPLAIFYKVRDYSHPNKVEKQTLLGEVAGKDALVIDDMIDTAGTIVSTARLLKEAGAKDVYLVTSLPLLTGPAVERITAAYNEKAIKMVIGTDAVYHGEEFIKNNPWYVEVSVAGYFAEVINHINKGFSIRALLKHN